MLSVVVAVRRTARPAASIAALVMAAGLAAPGLAQAERIEVGRSAEDRPIVASRLGDPDSPRKALVVGQIHGDEPGGLAVTRRLRRLWGPRLRDVDLWVVDSFNPDGQLRQTRQNARMVDLNRNFPYRWQPNGTRGSRYWGGNRPLSEPESRAIRRLILHLRPAVTIWYHQPWGAVLSCGRGSAEAVPRHYARLARMGTSCRGNRLPGTAATWQNHRVGGTAFVVELAAGRVGAAAVRRNARAAALVAQGR